MSTTLEPATPQLQAPFDFPVELRNMIFSFIYGANEPLTVYHQPSNRWIAQEPSDATSLFISKHDFKTAAKFRYGTREVILSAQYGSNHTPGTKRLHGGILISFVTFLNIYGDDVDVLDRFTALRKLKVRVSVYHFEKPWLARSLMLYRRELRDLKLYKALAKPVGLRSFSMVLAERCNDEGGFDMAQINLVHLEGMLLPLIVGRRSKGAGGDDGNGRAEVGLVPLYHGSSVSLDVDG